MDVDSKSAVEVAAPMDHPALGIAAGAAGGELVGALVFAVPGAVFGTALFPCGGAECEASVLMGGAAGFLVGAEVGATAGAAATAAAMGYRPGRPGAVTAVVGGFFGLVTIASLAAHDSEAEQVGALGLLVALPIAGAVGGSVARPRHATTVSLAPLSDPRSRGISVVGTF